MVLQSLALLVSVSGIQPASRAGTIDTMRLFPRCPGIAVEQARAQLVSVLSSAHFDSKNGCLSRYDRPPAAQFWAGA
jgi:hypothetical protein